MVKSLYDIGNGMVANGEQKIALDSMVDFIHSDYQEFTLSGKGGTGKTTIIKKIVQYYNTYKHGSMFFNNSVVGATISHYAKNVLRNSLGNLGVQTVTVAKLLGMKQSINDEGEIEFKPEPKTWKVAPPPIKNASLLIIDECSMISKSLLSLLREHKLPGTKIIFLGDIHQLPPIDSQREMDEDSETFSLARMARLDKRMRQSKTNPIVKLSDIYADNIDNFIESGNLERFPLKNSHRVDNYNPITNEGYLFPRSPSETFAKMLKDFEEAYERNNPNFVRAIAFRNSNKYGKAPFNINSINKTVRKHLWKTDEEYVINETLIANNQYMQGRDLVLQNGDIMLVKKIKYENHCDVPCCLLDVYKGDGTYAYRIPVVSEKGKSKYKAILKKFVEKARKNSKVWKYFYEFKANFADINYGYATTSHKAQGSGFNNVYVFEDDIMTVGTTSYKEKSQCMYTAITRAIEKLVIYSEKNKKAKSNG